MAQNQRIHRFFCFPQSLLSIQLVHVSNQNRIPIEMDQVGLSELIKDRCHRLAACADKVCDVLLGEAVFYQRFKWAVIVELPKRRWTLTSRDIDQTLHTLREPEAVAGGAS